MRCFFSPQNLSLHFSWQAFAELNYLLLRSVNMKFDTCNKQVPLMYLCPMPMPKSIIQKSFQTRSSSQESYQILWNNHVFIAGGQMEARKQVWWSREEFSQPPRRGTSWSWFVDFQGFIFEKIFATDFWLIFWQKKIFTVSITSSGRYVLCWMKLDRLRIVAKTSLYWNITPGLS